VPNAGALMLLLTVSSWDWVFSSTVANLPNSV